MQGHNLIYQFFRRQLYSPRFNYECSHSEHVLESNTHCSFSMKYWRNWWHKFCHFNKATLNTILNLEYNFKPGFCLSFRQPNKLSHQTARAFLSFNEWVLPEWQELSEVSSELPETWSTSGCKTTSNCQKSCDGSELLPLVVNFSDFEFMDSMTGDLLFPHYSGDLNTWLVWYSNGQKCPIIKWSVIWMVIWIADAFSTSILPGK